MADAAVRRWPGHLVSVEGVDGAGKSTQAAALASSLRSDGLEVVSVREPGQTALGEALRELVLHRRWEMPVDPWAEALLLVAARAQLLGEHVLPALQRGAVVVCDRFVDSTLAYQGGGRGLGMDALRRLHADACGDVWPDVTVLLALPDETARERRRAAELPLDRIERALQKFHAAVARAFAEIAAAEPHRIVRVDAAQPPAAVAAAVRRAVLSRLQAAVPA